MTRMANGRTHEPDAHSLNPISMALQPSGLKHGSIEELRNNFVAGRYADAIALFDLVPSLRRNPEAMVLRARIHLKADDAPSALKLLNRIKGNASITFARDLFLGVAYARSHEFRIADKHFAKVDAKSPDQRAELAYWRGWRHWLAEDRNGATAELLKAQKFARSKDRRLQALHLESFIATSGRRYREQARVLSEILRQIAPGSTGHVEIEAFATHSLAALAREIDEPAAIPLVQTHVEAAQWPADFDVQRFQALKALGWAVALRGDYFNAFRFLRQSAKVAPDPAWRVVALADRAYLARCLSEHWSREELDEAEETADAVNWRASRGEERIALLLLAELFAEFDASRASTYLAQYRECGGIDAPLMHLGHDDRLRALEDYSSGVVYLAIGERNSGIRLLQKSFDEYDRIGYDWRAGRCAVSLFSATKRKQWLDRAREKLRAYPHSWLFAQLLHVSGPADPLDGIPPVRRRVLEELRNGRPPAEIARSMNRSVFTVRNHIKVLFKTFGVTSQAGLLAETARRGSK